MAAGPLLLFCAGFREPLLWLGSFGADPLLLQPGNAAAHCAVGPAQGQLPPRTDFRPISSPSATDAICQAHPGTSHSPAQPPVPCPLQGQARCGGWSLVSQSCWARAAHPACVQASICPPVVTLSPLARFNQI